LLVMTKMWTRFHRSEASTSHKNKKVLRVDPRLSACPVLG
jgi:hypothetical protein